MINGEKVETLMGPNIVGNIGKQKNWLSSSIAELIVVESAERARETNLYVHYHKNNTHLAWIEVNECGQVVISSLLSVSVLTSECELRSKFQHISALRCECQYTHLWVPKHLDLSAGTLRIELNVVPTKK